MKPTGMHPIILCVVLGIVTACSMSSPPASTVSPTAAVVPQPTSQIRASDRMLYWQEEARELQAMATHREREAELALKKTPGPATKEFVKRMQLLVHQLQEAAEYADAQAKEPEREVPPDVIQQLHSALDNSLKADIKAIDAAPAVGGASHGISADQ